MGKKVSTYNQAIRVLQELHRDYPNKTLGEHLATALQEDGYMWGMTDREFLFLLEKYKTEMELNIVSDAEVDKVIRDAQNLDKLFQEEDDYE